MKALSTLALIAALLVCSAVLAGCSTTRGGYSAITDDQLSCKPAPKSPAADPAATEEDGALYVTDLAEAGADCRSKLRSVREILRPE